ncbi:MAG: hypothetical protein HRT45_11955 [Bdellovibrionales bacterium]|nr:hypothetical protein [Bdellovibrionales bacterium]
MKLMTFVVFLIGQASFAAPSIDGSLEDSSPVANEKETANENLVSPLLSIDKSPLNKKKPNPLNFLYPYKRSVTARTGLIVDPDKLNDGSVPFLVGAAYMLYNKSRARYEALFNFTTESVAQLGLSRRHMINEPNHFRGFWSYGGVLQLMPEERFATFANFENYFASASIGMEDVTNMPKSVRLEIHVLVGAAGQSAILYVGSSWGLLKGR